MPDPSELQRRMYRDIHHNLEWLNSRYALGMTPADLADEATSYAGYILAVLMNGCQCTPPVRSTEANFWLGVKQCEREHQITIQDLVQANWLHDTDSLQRTIDGVTVQAAVGGAACEAGVDYNNERHQFLAEVNQRALASLFPDAKTYKDDERFWFYQNPNGAWRNLTAAALNAMPDPLPLAIPLRGYYLGYEVCATLMPDKTVIGNWTPAPPQPFSDRLSAAAMARSHVWNVLRPHSPWADWQRSTPAGVEAMKDLQRHYWNHLATPAYNDQTWTNETCHKVNHHPISLTKFLNLAATAGRLPGRAAHFISSILFAIFTHGTRRLQWGKVIVCRTCNYDTDGHGCNNRDCPDRGMHTPPRTKTITYVFFEDTRRETAAWRCLVCEHHWIATDPSPNSPEQCPYPQCTGGHGQDPITVWQELV